MYSCKVSLRIGKPNKYSRAHNLRENNDLSEHWIKANQHIDPERSGRNVVLFDQSAEEFLMSCCADRVDKHNEKNKKKHKERCTTVEAFSAEFADRAQETIMQLGNEEQFGALVAKVGRDRAEEIHIAYLQAAVDWWQRTNPNYPAFSAVIHLDERVPHLHLDFIPVADTDKLKQIVSVRGALKQMGFTNENGFEQKREFMYDRHAAFEEFSRETMKRLDRDFVILPSEPCLRGHQTTPEWRVQQFEQASRAAIADMHERIIETTEIEPKPPVYKRQQARPQAEEPVQYQGESRSAFKARHKEWEQTDSDKAYKRYKAEFDATEDAKVAANAAEREKWDETSGVIEAAQSVIAERSVLSARESNIAEKERASAEQARRATLLERVIDRLRKILGLTQRHTSFDRAHSTHRPDPRALALERQVALERELGIQKGE